MASIDIYAKKATSPDPEAYKDKHNTITSDGHISSNNNRPHTK